jgi:aryl-alcohol dehydrogenase-like predicted oxidoreductase
MKYATLGRRIGDPRRKIRPRFGRRDELGIATKVYNPVSMDFTSGQDPRSLGLPKRPNQQGLSRKRVFAAIDASLQRLGMDYVDLYQVHRWDYATPVEEFMEALHDVVKSGKAGPGIRLAADKLRQQCYAGESDRAVAAEVGRIAKERGVSRAHVACAWLLSPLSAAGGVTSPIVGPQTAAQLEALVDATSLDLTKEEVRRLEGPYRPKPVLGHF